MTTALRRKALPLADLARAARRPPAPVIDHAAAESLAAVLKALAEPTRLRLLSLIAAHGAGGRPASATSPNPSD